jgi:hypothetical protein
VADRRSDVELRLEAVLVAAAGRTRGGCEIDVIPGRRSEKQAARSARTNNESPEKLSSGGFLRNRLQLPSRDSIYNIHPSSMVTRRGSK